MIQKTLEHLLDDGFDASNFNLVKFKEDIHCLRQQMKHDIRHVERESLRLLFEALFSKIISCHAYQESLVGAGVFFVFPRESRFFLHFLRHQQS